MKQDLIRRYKNIFQSHPTLISSAPGRINIIGEHTDYNGGFVLPAAIHLRIYFCAALRTDDQVCVWAEDFKEERSFSLRPLTASPEHHWENYIKGIFWILQKNGYSLGGINGYIRGNIPLGSGLSSSAALEVCVIEALDALFRLGIDPMEMAKLAQGAENEFVGMQCGLMDQFISVFGKKNRAVFLDCLSLNYEHIPLRLSTNNLSFLVYDSHIRRELSSSEYNKRRSEASAAEVILQSKGMSGYREATADAIHGLRKEMGPVLSKRARHVVSENARVRQACQALRNDDFLTLGKLLFQSHMSLRDDYEVSCPELDLLYDFGREFSGCLGCRLTGAGFGGSGIVLMEENKRERFTREILDFARKKGYRKPSVFPVRIDEGAKVWVL